MEKIIVFYPEVRTNTNQSIETSMKKTWLLVVENKEFQKGNRSDKTR